MSAACGSTGNQVLFSYGTRAAQLMPHFYGIRQCMWQMWALFLHVACDTDGKEALT